MTYKMHADPALPILWDFLTDHQRVELTRTKTFKEDRVTFSIWDIHIDRDLFCIHPCRNASSEDCEQWREKASPIEQLLALYLSYRFDSETFFDEANLVERDHLLGEEDYV